MLFDIVDRMQLPAAGSFRGTGLGMFCLERGTRENCGWLEITEMLRVPRRSVEKLGAVDQALKGI